MFEEFLHFERSEPMFVTILSALIQLPDTVSILLLLLFLYNAGLEESKIWFPGQNLCA